jgi:hypothetical protein
MDKAIMTTSIDKVQAALNDPESGVDNHSNQRNQKLLEATFPGLSIDKLEVGIMHTISAPPMAGATALAGLLASNTQLIAAKQSRNIGFVTLNRERLPDTSDGVDPQFRFRRWLFGTLVPIFNHNVDNQKQAANILGKLRRLRKPSIEQRHFSDRSTTGGVNFNPLKIASAGLSIFFGNLPAAIATLATETLTITTRDSEIGTAEYYERIARLTSIFKQNNIQLYMFIDSDDWTKHRMNKSAVNDWRVAHQLLSDLMHGGTDQQKQSAQDTERYNPFTIISIKNNTFDRNMPNQINWPRLNFNQLTDALNLRTNHSVLDIFEDTLDYEDLLEASAGYLGHAISILKLAIDAETRAKGAMVTHNRVQDAVDEFGRRLHAANKSAWNMFPKDNDIASNQADPELFEKLFSGATWPMYREQSTTNGEELTSAKDRDKFSSSLNRHIDAKMNEIKAQSSGSTTARDVHNYLLRNSVELGWLTLAKESTAASTFLGEPEVVDSRGYWFWLNSALFNLLDSKGSAKRQHPNRAPHANTQIDQPAPAARSITTDRTGHRLFVPIYPSSATDDQRHITFIDQNLEREIPYWVFDSPKITGTIQGKRTMRDFAKQSGYDVHAPLGDKGPRLFKSNASTDRSLVLSQPYLQYDYPLDEDDFYLRQKYLEYPDHTGLLNREWLLKLFSGNPNRFIHLQSMLGASRGGLNPDKTLRKQLREQLAGLVNPQGSRFVANESENQDYRIDRNESWQKALVDPNEGPLLMAYFDSVRPFLKKSVFDGLLKQGNGMWIYVPPNHSSG